MNAPLSITIIKESEWCRGNQDSALLLPDGTKCCLGFDVLRRGYTEEDILEVPTPETLTYSEKLVGLVDLFEDDGLGEDTRDTETVNEIVRINDNQKISDDERKEKLVTLFAKLDTELVFVP